MYILLNSVIGFSRALTSYHAAPNSYINFANFEGGRFQGGLVLNVGVLGLKIDEEPLPCPAPL